jgi:hypothetical protein
MAYRYNIHGSNALLSIVTCTEEEGSSISSFSNDYLSPYILQDPLKRTDIVTGSVGFEPCW